MKRIVFNTILILTFCFAVFAQSNEKQSKPVKIREYWQDPTSETAKFSIYDLYKNLEKDSKAEGIIRIQAKQNKTITLQLAKIRKLLAFFKVDSTRISFAINNSDKEIIQFWFVPINTVIPECSNCLIIKAEDYDRLSNFFSPKYKRKKQ